MSPKTLSALTLAAIATSAVTPLLVYAGLAVLPAVATGVGMVVLAGVAAFAAVGAVAGLAIGITAAVILAKVHDSDAEDVVEGVRQITGADIAKQIAKNILPYSIGGALVGAVIGGLVGGAFGLSAALGGTLLGTAGLATAGLAAFFPPAAIGTLAVLAGIAIVAGAAYGLAKLHRRSWEKGIWEVQAAAADQNDKVQEAVDRRNAKTNEAGFDVGQKPRTVMHSGNAPGNESNQEPSEPKGTDKDKKRSSFQNSLKKK
jgi:hypothetical protein